MTTKQPKTLYGWEWETYRAVITAAFLISALAVLAITVERAKRASPEPLGQTIVAKVEANEPSEDYYRQEPLRYIRWKGQQLGIDDYTITRFITVAKCESRCSANPKARNYSPTCIAYYGSEGLDPYAKNPNSTARGVYQIIISTWEGNDCDGKRTDFVDNINCAFKIFQRRGFQPWDASKHCWDR